MKFRNTVYMFILLAILSGCATKISGTVHLLDETGAPLKAENPSGTVINMINLSAPISRANYSVEANDKGLFEKKELEAGEYKVEASRLGFATETQGAKLGKFSHKKFEFKLKKIPEGKRKSIKEGNKDEEKIINPGEVNIQPPSM
ncbi:MAG: carboxypeptidase regulatory-like domain-containing protein [Nitrospirae bacterium]|nr:carboxypeptidase regulatory-like domain-containing protein [Nitrospirota bacterium]